jgi:hypothetical protein
MLARINSDRNWLAVIWNCVVFIVYNQGMRTIEIFKHPSDKCSDVSPTSETPTSFGFQAIQCCTGSSKDAVRIINGLRQAFL